mgnify:CR=1 FL=1
MAQAERGEFEAAEIRDIAQAEAERERRSELFSRAISVKVCK